MRIATRAARAVHWGGVLETLGVLVFFVVFGLAWAGALRAAPAPQAPHVLPAYSPAVMATGAGEPSTWLIDGFNVLHVGLLGGRDRSDWWTEPRRSEVLERVRHFDDPRAELWVVFDGPRPEAPAGGDPDGPRCVFADSADAWLLAQVRAAPDPGRIAVVTADRRLAERVRRRGARVLAPNAFLARCPG